MDQQITRTLPHLQTTGTQPMHVYGIMEDLKIKPWKLELDGKGN